ncbi:hypothetical protein [Streptomyces gilvosporeus]|uniref:Uncharacterized protein n=1 Tax=Streptomyces gilvosporeus TaxID=553510 RepID=A0A1V0TJT8_9ACTN|nr:hypothetical protein [Streptomyces gilvosporeus]ARF53140.1 hypothetical protein B1H19_02145 [Streptomyces gilvosporeus]
MTLTVETAISQVMETWRRLGVDEDTAAEMAEELAADLTAAAQDGRDISAFIGGDVDALATSWAVERGLLPLHRRLKESALAGAGGAFVPAVLALAFCFLSWSHTLDACTGSGTGPDGEALGCRPTLDAPWMWVGWAVCMPLAFFMIRHTVRVTLQHHLAPVREATMRALTKTLPLIELTAALVGGGIGLLAQPVFGYFAILAFPFALVGMLGTVAAGVALVRHRTCPTADLPAK